MVTGSSGFVGTYFIQNSPEYSIREADLLNQKVTELNFSDCDCVIHLAAMVHQMKNVSSEKYFVINRDLAYEVATLAKAQRVKQFIFMSSVKVYGESTTDKNPWIENTPCNPIGPYGESKYQAEKLLQSLEDKYFKVAIIRSPLVYGPGVRANMLKIIKLIDKYPILPLGGIYNKRSMIFIGNLVAMIKQIIIKKESGVFIAGDQTILSTTTLAELIARNLNKRISLRKIPNIIVSGFKHLSPSITDRIWGSLETDNSITNKKLGFQPPYSTEFGIKSMIEWYLEEKLINNNRFY